jgi:hypothetical protein
MVTGACPEPWGSIVRIDFNRLRFLVIDDNAHMRRILHTTRGAFCAEANTSASARRTSGDGSSSSMIIAPSAAARSSGDRSEWR